MTLITLIQLFKDMESGWKYSIAGLGRPVANLDVMHVSVTLYFCVDYASKFYW